MKERPTKVEMRGKDPTKVKKEVILGKMRN